MQDELLAVGSILSGKWRISHVIGSGGMATVYAAAHHNGKRVAIKVLHSHFRTNERARARFLREGYIANRVDHPAVPSVLDDGVTEEQDAFLVMDLLNGESLETRRTAQAIAPAEVLRIAYEVLDVLATAHEKGVVHRDIKPANVFITVDGTVKVLDFGIASIREALPVAELNLLTQAGAYPGTPAFMAPEQARGRWELVDARSDVWAVGALMFTLLARRTVHEAVTTNELLIAAATTPATPVGTLRPDLSAALKQLIDRALSLHSELRWPGARAMQSAITALAQESPVAGPQAVLSLATLPEPGPEATTGEELGAVLELPKVPQPRRYALAAATLLVLSCVVVASSRNRADSREPDARRDTRHAQQSHDQVLPGPPPPTRSTQRTDPTFLLDPQLPILLTAQQHQRAPPIRTVKREVAPSVQRSGPVATPTASAVGILGSTPAPIASVVADPPSRDWLDSQK